VAGELQCGGRLIAARDYACVQTWLTDFRRDLTNIDVPVLVVHGTEDRILPFESTAKRLPNLVPNLKLVPVEGGPHNVGWTYPEESNKALLDSARIPATPVSSTET
jgi:non-heme chloroperoxidase